MAFVFWPRQQPPQLSMPQVGLTLPDPDPDPWLFLRNGDTRFSAPAASPAAKFPVSRLDCLCCRVSVIIAGLAKSQTSSRTQIQGARHSKKGGI